LASSFGYHFIAYLFSFRKFKKSTNIGKVMGKKVDCLKRHVHWGTIHLKDKFTNDPTWQAGTFVTASHF